MPARWEVNDNGKLYFVYAALVKGEIKWSCNCPTTTKKGNCFHIRVVLDREREAIALFKQMLVDSVPVVEVREVPVYVEIKQVERKKPVETIAAPAANLVEVKVRRALHIEGGE